MKRIVLILALSLSAFLMDAQEEKNNRFGTLRLVSGLEITGEYHVNASGEYVLTDENGDVFIFAPQEIRKLKGDVKVSKMSYPKFEQNVEFSTGGWGSLPYLCADVKYTFGVRMAKWLFLGVGVGLDLLPICVLDGTFDRFDRFDEEFGLTMSAGDYLPERLLNGAGYVQLRTYFNRKRKTMPFLSFSAGGYVSLPKCSLMISTSDQPPYDELSYPANGLMASALFGLDWRMNHKSSFYLAFGTHARQLWKITEYTRGSSLSAKRVFYFVPSLNLGFTF